MSKTCPHSEYYRDRLSEQELCYDFPGDELFISGLHAMQVHFYNNGTNIEIPVLRVMNTAHFLAAYMFSTTCTGDQMEYDTLANCSLGRDKQLFKVAIIVLAAMLQRTDGLRARNCRNILLDNRDPDFQEGVTLYDRFLRSAERRFSEEDFMLDTNQLMAQLREKDEIISRQTSEIISLNYTLTTMKQQLTQINIGTQIGTQINNYYYSNTSSSQSAESHTEAQEEPREIALFSCITEEAKRTGKAEQVEQELRNASKATATKLVAVLRTNEALGYVLTEHLSSRELYDLLNEHFGLRFTYHTFSVYRSKKR